MIYGSFPDFHPYPSHGSKNHYIYTETPHFWHTSNGFHFPDCTVTEQRWGPGKQKCNDQNLEFNLSLYNIQFVVFFYHFGQNAQIICAHRPRFTPAFSMV